ncbi:MAG: hypothetical protein RL120_05565, partial [Gammaproteobacteria bacterium]
HRLQVVRADGSTDEAALNSRSFLRHDLAHLAVEMEVPLKGGFWGSIAAGNKLDGSEFGRDIGVAEKLAGPVQTLMRKEAGADSYLQVLRHVLPERADIELAQRIHERIRQIRGHWRATPFGGTMELTWQE